jgi:hypothetical protein
MKQLAKAPRTPRAAKAPTQAATRATKMPARAGR